jgi:PAS domain S-box-containing protein
MPSSQNTLALNPAPGHDCPRRDLLPGYLLDRPSQGCPAQQALGFLQASLDGLAEHVAVLDRQGRILLVNRGWRVFGRANGLVLPDHGLGADYLAVAEAAAGEDGPAGRVLEGLRQILAGRRERVEVEYPCHSPAERRWFLLTARALVQEGSVRGAVVSHENITPRRRALEELQATERHYRTIFENAYDGLSIYERRAGTRRRRLVDCNQSYAQMAGRDREELLAHPDIRELQVRYHDQAASQEIQKRLERGEAYGGLASWVRPDGRENYHEYRAVPVEHDGCIMVYGVDRNVTDRLRAEKRLREANELFQATFEQAAVGICHLSPQGRFQRVNQRLCDILGYTREELLELTFQEITHPEDLESDLRRTRRLLAGEIASFSLEKRYRRGDGGWLWGNLTMSLLRDANGGAKFFIAVVEDISHSRQARDELAWEASASRAAAELAKSLISAQPKEFSSLLLQAARRLTASAAGWVGSLDLEASTWEELPPGSPQLPREVLLWALGQPEAQRLNQAAEQLAAQGVRPGRVRTLLSAPAEAAGHKVGQVILVNAPRYEQRDLLLVKRLASLYAIELKERKREARLRREESARLAAEEATRAKSAFLANMSHEIRTPLTGILGTAQTLQRRRKRGLASSGHTEQGLDDIVAMSRHLGRLVDDVLDISRIESGRLEAELGEVSLAEVVETVHSNLASQAQSKGLRFIRRIPEDLPTVWSDHRRLCQVIINLVGNAIKFTSQGSVSLEAKPFAGNQGKVLVVVRDTGPGIPPEEADSVFDRFVRLDPSGSTPGAGLGLAISRKLLELMEGRIWVDSQPGHGAAFCFTLNRWNGQARPAREVTHA